MNNFGSYLPFVISGWGGTDDIYYPRFDRVHSYKLDLSDRKRGGRKNKRKKKPKTNYKRKRKGK